MTIRFVSIFLFVLTLNMPMLVSAQESLSGEQQAHIDTERDSVSEVQQARTDAERDAEKNISSLAWGFGGFACNVFGIAYAYFAKPSIPAGVLLEKSPSYTDTYTEVYRYHAKQRRLQAAVIGFGVLIAISVLARVLRKKSIL